MSTLSALTGMRKHLRPGVFAAILTALVGLHSTGVAADATTQLWSIAVHIEYADGFVYDHAFATGVPTSQLSSMLAACGRSHAAGSAVRFHCYPIPE